MRLIQVLLVAGGIGYAFWPNIYLAAALGLLMVFLGLRAKAKASIAAMSDKSARSPLLFPDKKRKGLTSLSFDLYGCTLFFFSCFVLPKLAMDRLVFDPTKCPAFQTDTSIFVGALSNTYCLSRSFFYPMLLLSVFSGLFIFKYGLNAYEWAEDKLTRAK